MTRRTVARSRPRERYSRNMSIEEKLFLMDQLYQRAIEDGSLERYRREREKGVEEVRRRWQLLRERLLSNSPNHC